MGKQSPPGPQYQGQGQPQGSQVPQQQPGQQEPFNLGKTLGGAATWLSPIGWADKAFNGGKGSEDFANFFGQLTPPAPPPPDYQGAAQQQANSSQQNVNQQTQANRPNINTPFGFQNWHQDPATGQWSMQTGLGGALGGASSELQNQAGRALSTPMDWSQFGQMGDGSAARDQAINAAYSQSTSRLDPQWAKREEAQRTQLLNQGLDPSSEAARGAMSDLGQQRNDAYQGAMNSAIGQGTQAGQAVFNQNMMARQQAIAEALRQRGGAVSDLQSLQGFMSMPGFQGAGQADPTQWLTAAMANGQFSQNAYNQGNANSADAMGGLGQVAGAAASLIPFLLSDERAKEEIIRLPQEALPGVPFATWKYKGREGRHFGVIAQDLQRVSPGNVVTAPDGMLYVDYSFLSR